MQKHAPSECSECDDLGWVWEYGIEEQWKVPCPRWCKAADRWHADTYGTDAVALPEPPKEQG